MYSCPPTSLLSFAKKNFRVKAASAARFTLTANRLTMIEASVPKRLQKFSGVPDRPTEENLNVRSVAVQYVGQKT